MRVSVSQYETFVECPTKWWRERVMNEGPASKTNVFGVVLHACCERLAKGEEPHPKGWEYAYDRWTGEMTGWLSFNEQALVVLLIKKARDEGWFNLELPRVEHEFKVQLAEDLELIGFIDIVEPGVVTDHKSAGSMKYVETEETLGDNSQLLIYAKVSQSEHLARVRLRHNIFCKSPPSVKRVEVTVERERIEEEWTKLVGVAVRMQGMRGVKDAKLVEKNEASCNLYGGCPFKMKCFPEEDY